MGFFEWGANIAERLAFAELLSTGEDFTGSMESTYKVFGFEENETATLEGYMQDYFCLLYTSPSPRDLSTSRMPSSA